MSIFFSYHMAKSTSLSSDIDFIKEFEELRIKQRLLIDNLKRKSSAEHEKILIELNSKLDFLVKIFKEANESEQDTDHLDQKFKELSDKIEEIEKKAESRQKEILDKISKMALYTSKEIKKTEELKHQNLNNLQNSPTNLSNNTEQKPKDNSEEPPAPDFKVDPQKPLENTSSNHPELSPPSQASQLPSPTEEKQKSTLSDKDSKVLDKLDVGKKKKWF